MHLNAIAALSTALACTACGLFLGDLSKGAGEPVDTGTDSDTSTDVVATPCDGVDLEIDPGCNLENTYFWNDDSWCDCPTCPWDASDCDTGDGGVPDAGTDSDTGI